MKKILVLLLIYIIIFNFILANFSFATGGQEGFTQESGVRAEEGTATDPTGGQAPADMGATKSTSGAIIGILAASVDVIPIFLNTTLNFFATQGGYINVEDLDEGDGDFDWVTIEKIVFGNYYLFSPDLFSNSTDLEVTDKDGNSLSNKGFVKSLDSFKESVRDWYSIVRIISLILGLLTLIYIGIRMAISTVASEQAKYKKMITAWVQSIVIIAVLPYIMNIINYAGSLLMELILSFKTSLEASGQAGFETTLLKMVYEKIENTGGMSLATYSIVLALLAWTQFKFFMMYMRRFLSVCFLVIISPLITITYSIDKAGDGKAQAFGAWFIEYFTNIMIQPLQAILYLIFVFSANEIAQKAPIVGVIFLLSLTRAEKIVKTIFNLRGLASINTMRLFKKK